MKSITDIALLINGKEFKGWDRWEVESDILQPADAFSLSVPNMSAEQTGYLIPNVAFKLVLDGRLVMRGYVDDVVHTTTASESRIEVTGRDDFGNLVDCSAQPGTHRKIDLVTLARALTSVWSMDWTVQPGLTLPTHSKVKVEPGDTVMDVIARLAKKDNLLVWFTSSGTATIGRPDYSQEVAHKLRLYTPDSGLQAENNIVSSRVRFSYQDRFSTYTVAGSGANDATNYGRSSLRKAVKPDVDFTGRKLSDQSWNFYPTRPVKPRQVLKITQADTEVTVPRPLIIPDGDIKTIQQATDRCELERSRRAFDSTVLEYNVRGHYGTPQKAGGNEVMYDADQRAEVVDYPGGVNGIWYITKRRFKLDSNGPSTDLTLHPDGVWLA